MPIKCVLDTNIILSAAISDKGNPARIFDAVLDKEIKMYLTEDIINEYKDVLSRDYFKISPEKIGRIINVIRKLGIITVAETSEFPMSDESDRVFFDAAQSMEGWLVTGNIRHYPPKSFVIKPADFCKRFKIL